jgi:hypothetical protein
VDLAAGQSIQIAKRLYGLRREGCGTSRRALVLHDTWAAAIATLHLLLPPCS